MKRRNGFTLLEILVALTIFAILATITSSSLYYAFNTRKIVNIQADKLSELQFAISIIQQDTLQMVDRAIRGNEMRQFPVLVGQTQYVEFTRDGVVNPNSIEKRSTLKRIGLVCSNGTLVHRTWESLDPLDRNQYEDRILINGIDKCSFSYLNQNVQSLSEWRADAVNEEQQVETFPKAIQINLTLKDWGSINLLFIVPQALYESI